MIQQATFVIKCLLINDKKNMKINFQLNNKETYMLTTSYKLCNANIEVFIQTSDNVQKSSKQIKELHIVFKFLHKN